MMQRPTANNWLFIIFAGLAATAWACQVMGDFTVLPLTLHSSASPTGIALVRIPGEHFLDAKRTRMEVRPAYLRNQEDPCHDSCPLF